MLQDGFFDPKKPLHIRWGELPHWRQDGALYFVTFRLSDSLPKYKLEEWRRERDRWRDENRDASRGDIEDFSRQRRRMIEKWLDRGIGCCVLRHPDAKAIMDETINHFANVRYELGKYAVAGNHLHVILRTALDIDLTNIVEAWKTHSGREIRRRFPDALRNRRHVWQSEFFDHIVRDEMHLERYTAYVDNHNR